MTLSSITVAGITPDLAILGAYQRFIYTQQISSVQTYNQFVPTLSLSSYTNWETRNNMLSGFRWIHTTTSTDTFGSLSLQSFVSASPTGTNILTFAQNGTINFTSPINLGSNIITVPSGGTGITSTSAYAIICGGTTSTGALQSVASLGNAGQVLTSSGPGALPTWTSDGGGTVTSITAGTGLTGGTITSSGIIGLSSPVSLTNGGTNSSLTASNGGIFYSTSTAGAVLSGTATANQLLLSGASGAPSWSTVTHPATTTINQILYSSAANTISGLATANNGVLTTSGAGVPSISSTLPTAVQGNITSVGTIASGTWNGTTVAVANGGTGISTTTPYGVICGGTTSTGPLQSVASLGNARQVLTSSGAGALPSFTNPSFSYCSILMLSNATTTGITANVYTKVLGLTSLATSTSNFVTATSNRILWNGTNAINVVARVNIDQIHSGTTTIYISIYKNGVSITTFVAPNGVQTAANTVDNNNVCAIIPMIQNDYLEVWATAANNTTLTVQNMQFVVSTSALV